MPPHWIRRGNKKTGACYLIDGAIKRSLKTTSGKLADQLVDRYIKGKYHLDGGYSVAEYYDKWIAEKEADLSLRKTCVRDYRQHFNHYILPEFRHVSLSTVDVGRLKAFLRKLQGQGLSIKTCLNIVNSSFRALWTTAKREGDVNGNPFEDIEWPRHDRERPDPFSIEERELILAWFYENELFYYPYVRFRFETGCRPSEATALRWGDLKPPYLSILKSRNLGEENKTKTRGSRREIKISDDLTAILHEIRQSWHSEDDYIFHNTFGRPLTDDSFVKVFWYRCMEQLEGTVKFRNAYKMRHTAITEALKRGNQVAAVAQYFGTSIQMIEEDYCGKLDLDGAKMEQFAPSSVASPTGFEPFAAYKRILADVVNTRKIKTPA
jgi:integrase